MQPIYHNKNSLSNPLMFQANFRANSTARPTPSNSSLYNKEPSYRSVFNDISTNQLAQSYSSHLNDPLCEVDHIGFQTQPIDIYSKIRLEGYVNINQRQNANYFEKPMRHQKSNSLDVSMPSNNDLCMRDSRKNNNLRNTEFCSFKESNYIPLESMNNYASQKANVSFLTNKQHPITNQAHQNNSNKTLSRSYCTEYKPPSSFMQQDDLRYTRDQDQQFYQRKEPTLRIEEWNQNINKPVELNSTINSQYNNVTYHSQALFGNSTTCYRNRDNLAKDQFRNFPFQKEDEMTRTKPIENNNAMQEKEKICLNFFNDIEGLKKSNQIKEINFGYGSAANFYNIYEQRDSSNKETPCKKNKENLEPVIYLSLRDVKNSGSHKTNKERGGEQFLSQIKPKKSALKKRKTIGSKKVTIAEHNNEQIEVSKWLKDIDLNTDSSLNIKSPEINKNSKQIETFSVQVDNPICINNIYYRYLEQKEQFKDEQEFMQYTQILNYNSSERIISSFTRVQNSYNK